MLTFVKVLARMQIIEREQRQKTKITNIFEEMRAMKDVAGESCREISSVSARVFR